MKLLSSLPAKPSRVLPIILGIIGMGMGTLQAATLMNMTFDNIKTDIDEVTGWDGTTAPGGSLATGLAISSGMKIEGDFTGSNSNDVFHVDGWHTGNSANTGVSIIVSALPSYFFNLGGGSETFTTLVHNHPTNGEEIFNTVTLKINSITIGEQTYTPNIGPQTLVWTIPANLLLNNLTSAEFKLFFTGTTDPGPNNHGPEWSKEDGAFVSFTGSVVPEPSQSMLVLVGLVMTVMTRRRRN